MNDNKKIVPCHNISNIEAYEENCEDIKNKKQITIGFVGGVRYFKENCKLIDTFANNQKYRLLYIGKHNADCDLEGYCKRKNVTNVYFKGEFKNENKPKLYKNIDLINALYGNDSLEVTTALPNRLYDGILFKKPVIATKGTYLGDVVEKYKLGITINIDNKTKIKYKIDNYFTNFESKKFIEKCNESLNAVLKQQKIFKNKILDFVNNAN